MMVQIPHFLNWYIMPPPLVIFHKEGWQRVFYFLCDRVWVSGSSRGNFHGHFQYFGGSESPVDKYSLKEFNYLTFSVSILSVSWYISHLCDTLYYHITLNLFFNFSQLGKIIGTWILEYCNLWIRHQSLRLC